MATTVTADKNTEYSTDPGNDTKDKVFLLSINEAEQYFKSDEERQLKGTEYAVSKGAYVTSGNGNSKWLLRSPGRESNFAAHVNSDGSINYVGNYVDIAFLAVRPAMWITIE